MSKLAYPLRFSNWTLEQYRQLDTELSALFRSTTRNLRSFPTALLYLPAHMGGMGLKRLSDIVQLDKWSSIHRLFRGSSEMKSLATSLIHSAFRREGIFPPHDSHCLFYTSPTPTGPPRFLTSLLEWGTENDIRFHISGFS